MSIWDQEWEWWDRLLAARLRFEPLPRGLTVAYQPRAEPGPTREWLDGLARELAVRSGTLQDWHFIALEIPPGAERGALLERLAGTITGRALPMVTDRYGGPRFFVPGRVSVQLAEGAAPGELDRLASQLGGAPLYRSRVAAGFGHLGLPRDADEVDVITRLNDEPGVRVASFAEFGLGKLPTFAGGEGCEAWGVGQVKADVVTVTGAAEVVVAIVDSGVDTAHPQLNGRLLDQPAGEDRDFLDPADVSPHEIADGHGTHVAGIVAAVAPDCKLLPVRVGLVNNGQDTAYKEALVLLANKVAGRSPQTIDRLVVNISHTLGSAEPPQLADAIRQADAAGALVIAAAGNGPQELDVQTQIFPASFSKVVAVAGTDRGDIKVEDSNFGRPIRVSAPGVDILSAWPGGRTNCLGGTSMAAPHAAGVAALIWRQHGSLNAAQVLARLISGCDNIGERNPTLVGKLGAGRINAVNSI